MRVLTGRVVNHNDTPTFNTRPVNRRNGTPNWLKALYATLAAVVVLAGLGIAFAPSKSDGTVLEPCKSESQTTACYWDAETMGNGHGRDFVNR
jgi:hypothetical protein